MAPSSSQGDDQKNDGVSSQPQTEETTATKRQRFTTSIGTLTPPLSDPPNDSLHAPSLPTLPFELITEILYRLPVKFLLQFRCICKSWKSLISDPNFAKKQLRVSTKRYLILTYRDLSRKFTPTAYPLSSVFTGVTAAPMHLEYPLNKRNCFDFLVGSCDGILCFEIDQNSALLFNPSIRKFKKLPDMNNPRKEGAYTVYSFGYDHVTDDYKVVAVFCYECDNAANGVYEALVNVYSLSTNRWRSIQEFPSAVPFGDSGTFVSGTVNWLAYSNNSSWIIVSLDLGNECYGEIMQPDYGDCGGVNVVALNLCVLRDCLGILTFGGLFSDIWIMKEYGNKESWTKLFCIPHMGDLGLMPYTKALYAYDDGRVLLECRSKLVVYDSRDGTYITLEIHNSISSKAPDVYIESLVSPCF